ncbi:MAG TPA: hypothetical protein VEH29_18665, partial [Acidimicrobiales bacterium]|nr:hypothetical protein [Acidimicrobiales bacterium]
MTSRTGVSAGLKEIVADYQSRGVDLSTDPRLAEAILLDSFPQAQAEINALVEAIRSGAIEYMRDRAAQGPEFSIHGSATQLSESAGLREDLARWAVESWWNALALGPEIPIREAEAPAGSAAAAAVPAPVPPPPPPPPDAFTPPPSPTATPPEPVVAPMGSSEVTQSAAETSPGVQASAAEPPGYPVGQPPSAAGAPPPPAGRTGEPTVPPAEQPGQWCGAGSPE